jgi:hypothetical protein
VNCAPGLWYLVLCFREGNSKDLSWLTLVRSLVLGTLLSRMAQQTALLTNFSLVLGTWYSAFGNITTNCSLHQHLLQSGPWYLVLCFREGCSKDFFLTNFSPILGTLLLRMSQQNDLLTNFSLVLGTWYSAFGNIKTNCSLYPHILQSGSWFSVLCFRECHTKLLSGLTSVLSLVLGTLLLRMLQQTDLLIQFSLVLGTSYSAFKSLVQCIFNLWRSFSWLPIMTL